MNSFGFFDARLGMAQELLNLHHPVHQCILRLGSENVALLASSKESRSGFFDFERKFVGLRGQLEYRLVQLDRRMGARCIPAVEDMQDPTARDDAVHLCP
eukprot:CAMPEP_0170189282 /NCGR_PEP_ID=MMETSP0040_2-20121228/46440_1 /TAXON_ID=641309 /ORGANISM="Lotharella oceanica, Strain CCMP622" /LENGTH=99 /DNA_ID=CAMNT_0010436805 /DNA_START=213 /DNA_END=512 /DNA_ORIENTATION=+